MGLMWTKHWGGKHAGKHTLTQPHRTHSITNHHLTGGGVIVDKHGVRRAPFRFSLGRLNCFR